MQVTPRRFQTASLRFRSENIVCALLIAVFLGFAPPEIRAFADEDPQQKNVLILYSFENEPEVLPEFDESLRSGLKSARAGPVKFFTEFLDLVRFANPEHEKQLQAFLKEKYSSQKIDLIIPVGLPAIKFIINNNKRLFPEVPVVFCATDRRGAVRSGARDDITGIVEVNSVDKTLAAALKLHPKTREVVLVGGSLPYEKDWMKEIEDDLRHFGGKIEINSLSGLRMRDLLKRLASLPEHTIVLYTMMWRDGAGEYFLPKEALARMAEVSSAPIYGLFDTFLGSGIVGGSLIQFKEAGKAVADLGTRVLRGESPANIPVLSMDNTRYAFDWRQFNRWHISEEQLPAGSLIFFKPASFWGLYRRLVIEVGLLIAVETLLIVLLLIQHRKIKQAEAGLRQSESRYLAFLALSSEGIARLELDKPMLLNIPEDDQVEYLLHNSRLAECNDAFAQAYGISMPQYLIGNRLADLFLPMSRQRAEFLHALARSSYRLHDYVTHDGDPEGELRWFENRATGVFESGQLVRLWLVQRDISDRKQAEKALTQEAAFNKMMNALLDRFATCASAELDAAVEKALQAMGEFIGADHAFVIRFQENNTRWGATHEWCGPNVTPKIREYQAVPLGTVPQHERLLLNGGIVRINSPSDYSQDAVKELQFQCNEGYCSELTVPIRAKEGIFGCIGLHSHARPKVWSENDVACLQMVGDAVATALERKLSIEELRKSEEKFSMAFHNSPVAMSILSLATGRYIEVNKAFERNTGYRADEILGRTTEELGIYPGAGYVELLNKAMEERSSLLAQELEYRTRAGDRRVALLSTEMIEFGGEPCMLRAFEDVTERKRVEKSLRELGARMLMVQEEERRRVARELHDDFSQRLALLAIDLEQLEQRPPATKQDWETRIRALWSQTQDLTFDIHRLSHQLHPSKLEDLGLVTAVRSYCHEISRQTHLAVEFQDGNVPRSLPDEVALCLYRIVQEALRNVVKHSEAKKAVVELKGGPDGVRLKISDSGKGFASEAARQNGGLGLIGMHERVLAVGGEISIWSRQGEGTRVEVRVPLTSVES